MTTMVRTNVARQRLEAGETVLVLGAAGQLLVWGRWPLAAWLLVLVLLPLLELARRLARADRRRHFRQLSAWCKGIMLAGILSMLLV